MAHPLSHDVLVQYLKDHCSPPLERTDIHLNDLGFTAVIKLVLRVPVRPHVNLRIEALNQEAYEVAAQKIMSIDWLREHFTQLIQTEAQ